MVHPKLAFNIASVVFGIVGVSYVLFPIWNAHLVFGDRLLRSSEPYTHCLMQSLGGVCLLLASTFCTASQCVTENLTKSVALGFFLNATLKSFSLISGWSGDTRKGAYEMTLPAWTSLITHVIMGILFWSASAHPDLRAAASSLQHKADQTISKASSAVSGAVH